MIAVIGRWLLTLVACAAVVVTGVLALRMLHLVELKSTFESLATLAVLFPLHLLVVTAAMVVLAFLASSLRGRFAAAIFGLVAILTAFLALWPSIAMWRLAR